MDINIKELEKEIENFRNKINNSEKIIESINSASENLIDMACEIEEMVGQIINLQQKQIDFATGQEKSFINYVGKTNEISNNINLLFEKYQANIMNNQEKINNDFLERHIELQSLIDEFFVKYNENISNNQKMFNEELLKERESYKVIFNDLTDLTKSTEGKMLSIQNKFNDNFEEKIDELNIDFQKKNIELKSLIDEFFIKYNENIIKNQKIFNEELAKERESNKVIINDLTDLTEKKILNIQNRFQSGIEEKINELNILFMNLSRTLNEYPDTTNQINASIKKINTKLNISFGIIIIAIIFLIFK